MSNNPGDRNAGNSVKDKGESQRSREQDFERTDKTQKTGSDINLRLTPEQQAQIRQATGKNLQSLSLSVEDLNQGSSSSGSMRETDIEEE